MKFARIVQFLLELVRAEFYGEIRIRMRKGVIGSVVTEQTYTESEQLPIKDAASLELLQTGKYSAAM
jgi:hypothetical protein